MTQNFLATQSNILTDGYLIRKIYTQSDERVSFDIYDTGHSIFPRGDYKNSGIDKFKILGHYSFSMDEDELFDDFINSLKRKKIIDNSTYNHYGNFFSLDGQDDAEPTIKNPYSYEFLKVHLSSDPRIAHKKMLDYIENLESNHIDYVNGFNEVYVGNWLHYFVGIKQTNGEYDLLQLDGLHPNEVEFDTSILMNCDPRDKDFLSLWGMLKSSRYTIERGDY